MSPTDLVRQQPLEFLPLWAVYILIAVILWLAFEGGYALSKVWERRRPDKAEANVGAISGAILGLLAFLLAFVTASAVDTFKARRQVVVDEANAIGTTYLRAGYLPDPASAESRQLLRDYVDTRLAAIDPTQTAQAISKSETIQNELWVRAETLAKASSSPTLALYIASLNEMIDIHTERVNVALVLGVPWALTLLLIVMAVFALGMVGLHAGYAEKRNPLAIAAFILTLAIVFMIIIDLTRSQEGLFQVSQQALLDLQRQIQPPP
jgi:hypothetical protein